MTDIPSYTNYNISIPQDNTRYQFFKYYNLNRFGGPQTIIGNRDYFPPTNQLTKLSMRPVKYTIPAFVDYPQFSDSDKLNGERASYAQINLT
jgi:hypothetical protein